MAYSGATKILKQGGEPLDKFEESVNQVWSVSLKRPRIKWLNDMVRS